MEDRLLVIDASLNKRIATELKTRGRAAIACSELQVADLLDPDLLRHLATVYEPAQFVFVSGDDALPFEHAAIVAELGLTVAIVNQSIPDDIEEDAYERDVVHRWAHVMAHQSEGSIRRYFPDSHRLWTRKRRRLH